MHVLRRHKWLAMLFFIPAFAFYSYIIIGSTLQTVFYSLTKWNGLGTAKFLGLEKLFANYQKLFTLDEFWMVMRNNVVGLVLALIIQLSFGLVFAYLLYRTVKFMKLYRSFSFVPVVMSASAVTLIFMLIFDGNVGPLNQILNNMGLSRLTRMWLSDNNTIYGCVLFPMIYQYIGQYIIIMLAGMQSIPEEVFESASIDGANSFQLFTRIVIPSQVDIILMCAVMLTSGAFKAFEHSWIMTGGYSKVGAFLGVYMYTTSFVSTNLGRGCAIAVIITLCSLLCTLILQRMAKRYQL